MRLVRKQTFGISVMLGLDEGRWTQQGVGYRESFDLSHEEYGVAMCPHVCVCTKQSTCFCLSKLYTKSLTDHVALKHP